MTRRIDKPDTQADQSLKACLDYKKPKSFVMVAGAGSGKTTTLVKGIDFVLRKHAKQLAMNKQQMACITYTDIATNEILSDIGNNPLVHVSTIHSFLWSVIKPFQKNIKETVIERLNDKINRLKEEAENFGARVQQRTKDKNKDETEKLEALVAQIDQVPLFRYGTGSDYLKGILGHNDIITVAPTLIRKHSLLRTLIAQKFPFIFVDESQDTLPDIVCALKEVETQMSGHMCLGFFGDPIQKIYQTGIGEVSLNRGWEKITKPENFRCPEKVRSVINVIRKEADGLEQTEGRSFNDSGAAHIFILPVDENRSKYLAKVCDWMSKTRSDDKWSYSTENRNVKILVIVHRMVANRLEFPDLYAAMNDRAPSTFKDGFIDGTAWPLSVFLKVVLPLIKAIEGGEQFEVMRILRQNCSLLGNEYLQSNSVPEILTTLNDAVNELFKMFNGEASVRELLHHIQNTKLIDLDSRLKKYINPVLHESSVTDVLEVGEDIDENEADSMKRFLDCPVKQFVGYSKYLGELSPYATQHGIKGAEFDRVLTVLDDEEGTHNLFSYNKYFGITPLSKADQTNIDEGKETVMDRTRRLFYVCCSRATRDLAIALFVSDVAMAKLKVQEMALVDNSCIHTIEDSF